MNALKDKAKADKLAEVIAQHKGQPGPLMPVMQAAQDIFGYLPLEVQNTIAEGLEVPLTEVYGVATFYSQFSLEAKGEHVVSVCMGTACYVKGAGIILDKLKEKLGVEVGKCTEDGMFSLEACRCIGACGLAPVMMINEDVYGRLSPDDIEGIIEKYKKD